MVRELDDEAVLLDLDTGGYYGLNPTGRRVWQLLVAGSTFAGTLSTLASEFAAPPAELAADVAAVLAELVRAGLVERAD